LNANIHLGSEDWQSGPDGVLSFGRAVGVPVSVDYVGGLLDEQLMRPTNS
jgi:hypothetical protein